MVNRVIGFIQELIAFKPKGCTCGAKYYLLCQCGYTKISSPSEPAAPSVESSMEDYIKNYPALFNLMKEYAPQETALNLGLAQQYAQPLGEAYKTAQEAMYPEETKFTKDVLAQSQEGIQSGVPDWMKKEYLDNLNASLGSNVGSGIAADYTSTGLLNLNKTYQDYYRDLGLSITGKQPISTAGTPQYTNQLTGYTPQGVMSYNAGNYATQAGMYNNQYNAYAQQAQNPLWLSALSGVGGAMTGLGGMATGFGWGTR